MAHDLKPISGSDFGSLAINDLLPERPALIGEFSPAYEAFRRATIADLAPVTKYEYLQALQLVDLNWAILQAKASADVELSSGTERTVRAQLNAKLEATASVSTGGSYMPLRRPAATRMTSRIPSTGMPSRRRLRISWLASSRGTQASGRPRRLRQSRWASARGSS